MKYGFIGQRIARGFTLPANGTGTINVVRFGPFPPDCFLSYASILIDSANPPTSVFLDLGFGPASNPIGSVPGFGRVRIGVQALAPTQVPIQLRFSEQGGWPYCFLTFTTTTAGILTCEIGVWIAVHGVEAIPGYSSSLGLGIE